MLNVTSYANSDFSGYTHLCDGGGGGGRGLTLKVLNTSKAVFCSLFVREMNIKYATLEHVLMQTVHIIICFFARLKL